MKLPRKKAGKGKRGPFPLGTSHEDFVRNLNEAERLAVFSRFVDRFWRESSAVKAPKSGLLSRLGSRLELIGQIAARRQPDSIVITPAEKLEYLFRRGFYANRWAMYKLHQNDSETYLSDLQALLLFRANSIYQPVLDNRLLFSQAFGQYFATPKVHAFKDVSEGTVAFSSEWQELIEGRSNGSPLSLLVQPLDASARGRTAVFTVQGGSYSGSGKSGSLAQMDSVIRDWAKAARSPYILLDNVRQGGFASALHPESVNLVHVLMSRSEADWAPRIDAAILQIGTRRSGPLGRVDNGGLSAWIDLDSGIVTQCMHFDRARRLQACQVHPDTGANVTGREVPGWSKIKQQLSALFDQSSYLRIAGFDFILQDAGPVLVGGTNLPDIAGIQVHRPLLQDRGFARFLRAQKI